MKRGMAVKLALVLGAFSAPVVAQDTVLSIPAGAELSLNPVMEQIVSETTEVSVQPYFASKEVSWPEHCLLSLTITPGESVEYSPGKMVCITAERQIIEAVPEGEIQLGQCVSSQGIDCATVNLAPVHLGTLLLTEPMELRLQPRNAF